MGASGLICRLKWAATRQQYARGLLFFLCGLVRDGGHNLSSDGSCNFTLRGFNNVDPRLMDLADNDGPTTTMALGPGSPAIDAGDDAAAPNTDQRYYLRAGPADIGAFEFNGIRLVSVSALSSNGLFRLERIGPVADPLDVHLSFAGEAALGEDYWVEGISRIGTNNAFVDIAIVPKEDEEAEINESVVVKIQPGLYRLGEPSNASISIVDNDSAVWVSALADAQEGASSNGIFRISRIGPTRDAIIVEFSLLGEAVLNEDYRIQDVAAPLGRMTILAGAPFVELAVEAVDDELVEAEESVVLELQPGNYKLGSESHAALTILDNDLLIKAMGWREEDGLRFRTVVNESGRNLTVEFSTNFTDWERFTNVVGASSILMFQDKAATSGGRRFYRAFVE